MTSPTRVNNEPFCILLTLTSQDFLGQDGFIECFFNIIDQVAKAASPQDQ
jgi:thiaminase/transcriptional activator TenA